MRRLFTRWHDWHISLIWPIWLLTALLTLGALAACGAASTAGAPVSSVPCQKPVAPDYPINLQSGYEVVAAYPHDPGASTQGLLFHAGKLYESTGLAVPSDGSSLRELEIKGGRTLRKVDQGSSVFSEGLALLGATLYQVTWKNQLVRLYDLNSFRLLDEKPLPGEAWGATSNGKEILLSDGSERIRFLNPQSLKSVREISVGLLGPGGQATPIRKLNELEWIEGEIWANQFEGGPIFRISPKDGKVLGIVPLLNGNGLAYDAEKKRIFATGKNWKEILEIRICRRE